MGCQNQSVLQDYSVQQRDLGDLWEKQVAEKKNF